MSHFKIGNSSIDFSSLLLSNLSLQLFHLFSLLGHASHVEIDWVQKPISLVLIRIGNDLTSALVRHSRWIAKHFQSWIRWGNMTGSALLALASILHNVHGRVWDFRSPCYRFPVLPRQMWATWCLTFSVGKWFKLLAFRSRVNLNLGCRLRLRFSALNNEGHVIHLIALILHLDSLGLWHLFSELAHRESYIVLWTIRVSWSSRNVEISHIWIVICHSAPYEVKLVVVGTIPMWWVLRACYSFVLILLHISLFDDKFNRLAHIRAWLDRLKLISWWFNG